MILIYIFAPAVRCELGARFKPEHKVSLSVKLDYHTELRFNYKASYKRAPLCGRILGAVTKICYTVHND